jgi:drug/metabolite transporter (DMT)-like permease
MSTNQQITTSAMSQTSQRRRNHALWLGVLLAVVGALSYFMYFVQFPALRDFPWVNLPLVMAGFILSTIGLWRAIRQPSVYRGKILGAIGFLLSLAIAGLFNYYIFSFSYQMPEPTSAVVPATAAPDFMLLNQQGHPVRLSDYRGKKVVLTFYRGYW